MFSEPIPIITFGFDSSIVPLLAIVLEVAHLFPNKIMSDMESNP